MELRAHCKGMAADFDFKKMSFVLEACGTLHNEQIEQAQSRTASALKKSLASAWELFSTNLESDQLLRDKYLASCSGDEARQRAAIIESLEAQISKNTKILGKNEELFFKHHIRVLFQCFALPENAFNCMEASERVPHGHLADLV